MEIRSAETFTDSLARLNSQEQLNSEDQKATKITAVE